MLTYYKNISPLHYFDLSFSFQISLSAKVVVSKPKGVLIFNNKLISIILLSIQSFETYFWTSAMSWVMQDDDGTEGWAQWQDERRVLCRGAHRAAAYQRLRLGARELLPYRLCSRDQDRVNADTGLRGYWIPSTLFLFFPVSLLQ